MRTLAASFRQAELMSARPFPEIRRRTLDTVPDWPGVPPLLARVLAARGVTREEQLQLSLGRLPHPDGFNGLGAAVDFILEVGRPAIAAREAELLAYGTARLETIAGLRLIGTAPQRAGVLSFVMEGVHPHDLGMLLDMEGIAVRTGHHCAQPVMARFGITATTRASIGLYNTEEELDRLALAIEKAKTLLL